MDNDTLSAAARTVTDMADHLARLKERATLMRDTFQARQRGYFSPTEDEQVRHLLVSYTHSRNALLELIESFRADPSAYDERRPEPFAIAYAAAILLVDAARFLRETWDHDPVVRRKLNEPEPYFGIEVGTYQRVQKSLTSPYHAWHLYHANAFYDRIAPTLRTSHATALEGVLSVIDGLGHRARVSPAQYARARLRVRTGGIAQRLRTGTIASALYAIQEYASRLVSHVTVRPGHIPSLPRPIRDQLHATLRPGDVLVTRKEHAATNYFLPGYWPHAALYIGSADDLRRLGIDTHKHVQPRWTRIQPADGQTQPRVIEALKDGVHVRSTDSPFGSDAIVAIRPRLPIPDIAHAIARGMFHEGKPYDFDFDFTRSDRLVCTEVVYRSYEGIGPMAFTLTRRAGRMTLTAEDLLALARRREHFDPLATYCPALANSLALGEQVDGVLDRTLGGLRPAQSVT